MMLENLFTGRSPSVIFVFAALQITYWLAVPFLVPPDFDRPLIWTGVPYPRRGLARFKRSATAPAREGTALFTELT